MEFTRISFLGMKFLGRIELLTKKGAFIIFCEEIGFGGFSEKDVGWLGRTQNSRP